MAYGAPEQWHEPEAEKETPLPKSLGGRVFRTKPSASGRFTGKTMSVQDARHGALALSHVTGKPMHVCKDDGRHYTSMKPCPQYHKHVDTIDALKKIQRSRVPKEEAALLRTPLLLEALTTRKVRRVGAAVETGWKQILEPHPHKPGVQVVKGTATGQVGHGDRYGVEMPSNLSHVPARAIPAIHQQFGKPGRVGVVDVKSGGVLPGGGKSPVYGAGRYHPEVAAAMQAGQQRAALPKTAPAPAAPTKPRTPVPQSVPARDPFAFRSPLGVPRR
jgi:hypothetical protein